MTHRSRVPITSYQLRAAMKRPAQPHTSSSSLQPRSLEPLSSGSSAPDYLLSHPSMRKHLETIEDGIARVLSDRKEHTVADICKSVRFMCTKVSAVLNDWEKEGSVIKTGGGAGEPFWWKFNHD